MLDSSSSPNDTSVFGAIIARAVSGDVEAGQILMDQFANVIARELRTQRRFQSLHARLDPSDIAQSVWRSFFSAVVGGNVVFRESPEVAAYLAKLTRNKIESQLRRHQALKRDVRKTIHACDHEFEQAVVHNPEHTATTLEFLQAVIARLTPQERHIAQRRAKGVTWDELAVELGSTAEAIRKRHVRAAERVTKELGDEHDGS